MADEERPEEGKKEVSEYEQFGEEYLGAKFRHTDDDDNEFVDPDLGTEDEDASPVADVTEETVETEEPQAEQTWTIPDTDAYGEHRGKKMTVKQIEEAGLLQTVFSRQHQENHHVGLYQDLKREFDAYRAAEEQRRAEAQRLAQERAQPRPVVNPQAQSAAIRAQYEHDLKGAAEAGVFEADFLEAYPHVATQIEHRFQNGANVLRVIAERVDELTKRVTGQEVTHHTNDSKAFVNEQLNTLASSDERLYGRLSTDEHKQAFINWMVADDNPLPFKTMKAKDLSAQVLSGAYVSYLHATRGDRPVPKKPAERKPNLATGTGGGPGTSASEKNEYTTFADDLRAARADRLRGV